MNTKRKPRLFYTSLLSFLLITLTLSVSFAEDICQGDFDKDRDVDGSDLAVFSSDFGRVDCNGDCEGDFDNDADVDGTDLAAFSANFGQTNCRLVAVWGEAIWDHDLWQ